VISNIYTVCAKAVFLSWVCRLPKVIVGIISVRIPLSAPRPAEAEHMPGYSPTSPPGSLDDASSHCPAPPRSLRGYTQTHWIGTFTYDQIFHLPSRRRSLINISKALNNGMTLAALLFDRHHWFWYYGVPHWHFEQSNECTSDLGTTVTSGFYILFHVSIHIYLAVLDG